jgi:predicted ATPase
LWLIGRTAESAHWSEWAVQRAEETEHPFSLAVALAYAAMTSQIRGDKEATAHHASLTQSICAEYDFAYYREWAVILGGWSVGGHTGIDQIGEGLQALRAQGAVVRQPYYLSLLAETWLGLGDRDAANAVLDAALTAAAERHDQWWVPELYRLKSSTCPPSERERMMQRGLTIARAHQSKALEERILGSV